ncbi:IS91 family transposase [Carboxylicivirga marina]|uniref:IS91 family transposase n=1 Tax=Carboxylicivirga marina TaxID=2800988 RepID=UPI0025923E78|nr:IS91 family transposase [uncultured Carboxylicivirga sp.]
MKPRFEVADVLNYQHGQIEDLCANSWQARALYALAACRTAQLGGHIDRCDNPNCQALHMSYNSCRNRHCPKCQGHKREEWIRGREADLLNTAYFHVVFTLPQALNRLALYKPELLYALLFKTANSVIQSFAANHKFMGAKTGMIAILHTWGQNLSLHPHLHCIVPGGGMTAAGKWKPAKGNGKYLFPVKAMSKVFRARMMAALRKESHLQQPLAKKLVQTPWVVYCKQPFAGPQQVIEYMGRYTHKVAISNHRLSSVDLDSVSFTAKDYRKGGQEHVITLSHQEFIRRLSLHVLPKGFVRMRHYGILASSLKQKVRELVEQQIGKATIKERPPLKHRVCYTCGKGQLVTLITFDARGPPPLDLLVYLTPK